MSARRNAALFLALAVLWGAAFPAISAGLEYVPPVLFAALRYDVAGVVLLGYVAVAVDQSVPRGRDQWLLVGVAALLLIAAYHALLFVGQQYTTAATAAVVVSLSPVLTTGFARAILPSERLTAIGVVGLLLGLAGVAVIARPEPNRLGAPDAGGVLLVAGAATAWALGSVLTKRYETDLNRVTMQAWAMLLGAGCLHVVSALRPGESLADVAVTVEAGLALGYLSILASVGGFLLFFDLLDRLGPIEINLVSYVVPIVAAVVGWLLLGEAVDAVTAGGFLLIAAGFALVKRRAILDELGPIRG